MGLIFCVMSNDGVVIFLIFFCWKIFQAWEKWDEGRPMDLVDRSIWDGCQHNEALRCIHLALLCVQDLAAYRPNMSSVVLMLETDNVRLPLPRQPTYTSMRRSVDEEEIWHGNQDLPSSNNVTVSVLIGR